jgi:hypothetical protein
LSADAFLTADAPNSANLLLDRRLFGILVAMLGSNELAYFPIKWAGLALLASCCWIDLSSKLDNGFRLFDRVDAAVCCWSRG